EIDESALVALIANRFEAQTGEEYTWHKDGREQPEVYKALLQSAVRSASLEQRRLCDFFAAFASEQSVDNTAKGLIKPTAFYMTSGQQSFLSIAHELAESFRTESGERIREVLFGPWIYKDKQHALGWDPAAERMYALRHKAPTGEPAKSVSAAIRLALEALPLFPVFPSRSGRLNTSGFAREERHDVFRWPVWQVPVGLDVLRTLLTTSEIDNAEILRRRGIAALYQSVRSTFGQGYGIFRPATLVWQHSTV
ncbi:MAG: type I-G CRISPR-associated protein, Cas3-extension family, partial [Gammaproteobacteria bacterium]